MSAVSLPQPSAQLCVTWEPCDCWACAGGIGECQGNSPMVCDWLTFDFDPQRYSGQRITIASTRQRVVDRMAVARQFPGIVLPLGCVVGSAVLGQPLPIVGDACEEPLRCVEIYHGALRVWPDAHMLRWSDISDQFPYSMWEPGRWAAPLTDAAPIQERCIWCWRRRGTGLLKGYYCHDCDGEGTADPFPVRGGPRIWQLTPERLRP